MMSYSDPDLAEDRKNSVVPQTQTQPEVKKHIADIFGDSDDSSEEDVAGKWSRVSGKSAIAQPTVVNSMNSYSKDQDKAKAVDDIFADSDTDSDSDARERRESSSLSRLKKFGSSIESKKNSAESRFREKEGDKKRKRKGKTGRQGKSKSDHKRKSRSHIEESTSLASSLSAKKDGYDSAGSGDSYDSGGEVERTKADDDFIDRDGDDDNSDYGGPQNFDDDERPIRHHKQRKDDMKTKKIFADPVSETIDSMKKKKHIEMTDAQKDKLCEGLYNGIFANAVII